MATKSIRVDVFQNQPDNTIKLSESITKKHDELVLTPDGSPLTGKFDMVLFKNQWTLAKQLRKDASIADGAAQSLYNQCTFACGLAKGQNKQSGNTIYVRTLEIRDVLQLAYRNTPESMTEFGFEVVVTTKNGHRYVRIDIPDDSPETLIDLAEDIIAKHEELTVLPSGSPLDGELDMVLYKTDVTAAKLLLTNSKAAEAESQSKNNQAMVILGYGEAQTSLTPDTVYNFNTGIRDRLLKVYEGTEEQLSEWGFEVVLGSYLAGRRAATPPVTPP
jgi:hypothetical protein